MDQDGKILHAQAEQARESGDFLKALGLTDQAMIVYQKAGDRLGFAEIQASRFLTLRHLYEQTNDKNYLILAKYAATASVEIAREGGNKEALVVPLFSLAKAQETLGELEEACRTYQEAVDNMINNPPPQHNQPGVLADFKNHLYVCQYKSGDKTVLEKAEQALQDLKEAEEESYNKNVWLSGGHMRIAEMLREDNPEKAHEHLQKAKEIIDSDERLTLRKGQWEKLALIFN